jgi:hypothetical protein
MLAGERITEEDFALVARWAYRLTAEERRRGALFALFEAAASASGGVVH